MKRITDSRGWRWYEDEGKVYASVTKTLDHIVPEKLQSYFKNNEASKQSSTLKVAGDFGTRLHEAVANDLLGLPTKIDGDIYQAFEQWKILKDKHGIKAKESELMVKSEQLGISGTLDILGWFEGELCVMDIKTGFYSKKTPWQISAYKLAYEEAYTEDLGMVALMVPRNGRSPIALKYTRELHRAHLAKYLACVETFKGLYWKECEEMNWEWLTRNSMDILYR